MLNHFDECVGMMQFVCCCCCCRFFVCLFVVAVVVVFVNYSLKQNKAQSVRAESTHKGVN